jgi:hypothetical protein
MHYQGDSLVYYQSNSPGLSKDGFHVARPRPPRKANKRPASGPVQTIRVPPEALKEAKRHAAANDACACRIKVDPQARWVDLVNRCTCELGKARTQAPSASQGDGNGSRGVVSPPHPRSSLSVP